MAAASGLARIGIPVAEQRRKQQKDGGRDGLVWGINPVGEALRGKVLGELLIQKGKGGPRIQELIDQARKQGVRLRFVEPHRLGVPKNCRHQGVVGHRRQAVLKPFFSLLEELAGEDRQDQRLLVLDSVQDPRNLGSILRSALAAGFKRVILPKERTAPVSGTVARTSAGALDHLELFQTTNLADSLARLKDQGFWIFGAVADPGAVSIYEADFSGPMVLVVGSEAKGIRPRVAGECDHLVTIPMQGNFDSLNVSVAAAIIMFEIARRAADDKHHT
jgi:23S rRNA (guanosine2251-2'-O)-methyltransferase